MINMKVLGITAEYNPFHNGHLYIAQKARQNTGADCVIAVMSGNFTQRGEAAISDKWTRAKAAVASSRSGVDLVIELPFIFACNRAKNFAAGGVDMLAKLGADCIAFGCEADDPDKLRNLALKMSETEDVLSEKTAFNMKEGVSHAKAYETAVKEQLGNDAVQLMSTPNNILALEYLKRIMTLRKNGMVIEDLPIKRTGSGYNDIGENYAGASKIREMIIRGEDISRFVPGSSNYENYSSIENRYFEIIKSIMLRSSREELSSIYCIGEGFENKLLKEIITSDSLDSYIKKLVSRRYTASAVRRMLTYVLLGVKGQDADEMITRGASCCRLLAAGNEGRRFMRCFESTDFSIVTNINKIGAGGCSEDPGILRLDIKASDMYNLLCGRDIYSCSDRVISPFIT